MPWLVRQAISTEAQETRAVTLSEIIRTRMNVYVCEGDEWLVACPWHSDTRPSLQINVKTGLYLCFACDARGNKKMLLDHLGITDTGGVSREALRLRSERLREHKGTSALPKLPEAILEPYSVISTGYWSQRGLSPYTVQLLELGYDIENDAGVIPLRALNGQLVGLVRRMLSPALKGGRYRYSKGAPISSIIYAANLFRHESEFALVEGPLDAAALIDVDIPALSLLGSRMSKQQLHVLLRLAPRRVVLFFDNDRAGRHATEKIGALLSGRCLVRVAEYAGSRAKDPGEMSPTERLDSWEHSVPFRKSHVLG
jgi:5S rRNA maturation endonuclease (ribonuclease M5)